MKKSFSKTSGSNQMRRVILLLGVAVILPTVCLLWFMMQAVKNERLAFRQKIIDVYSGKVRFHLTSLLNAGFEAEITSLSLMPNNLKKAPWSMIQPLKSPAMIVYDTQGQLVWPLTEDKQPDLIENQLFTKAQRLEYVDHNYLAALQLYNQITDGNDVSISSQIKRSVARCYLKAGDVENAQNIYQKISYPVSSDSNDYEYAFVCNPDVMRARVVLAELYANSSDHNFEEHLRKSLQGLVYLEDKNKYRTLIFTPDVWIWGLNRLIDLAEKSPYNLRFEIGQAKRRIKEQEYGSLISSVYDYKKVRDLEYGIVTSLETEPALYGLKTEVQGWQVLLIADTNTIVRSHLRDQWDKMNDQSCFIRLIDDKGRCLEGPNRPDYEPLITIAVGKLFSKWKLEVYLKDNEVFTKAASRQANVYMWTGGLVVLLILGSGLMAGKVVGKQIKLNRLKNDFIATVSHELKTPLASMRVLVDTLLEGNVNDKQQASEYLQLIAKENGRLSRLIDNFLTFSRMERNKQAFEIVKADPVRIAKAAAEAVQTKFNHENCKFTVRIDDGLASIMADSDAMVTVLVNLLDNAYKYTYDDKQIELNVLSEDGFICFSVKDNGIGMTRRQIRRIFDRFYQADNSLSRRSEGTGLGLSIVKFILDAHKAKIQVQSKPAKGSQFTVKIPVQC